MEPRNYLQGNQAPPEPPFDASSLSDNALMACIREAARRANEIEADAASRVAALRATINDPLGQMVACSAPRSIR